MKPAKKVARSFKNTLLFIIFLVVAFMIIGFYYGQDFLRDFAQSIAESNQTGTVSSLSLSAEETSKINSIFFEKTNYQDLVRQNLESYAKDSGLRVNNYEFANITPDATGFQTVSVDLKITSAVEYANLIKFLQHIETSLPKMQTTELNLSKDGTSDKVTVNEFKLEVYL